jgi:hypothetical protein
MCLGGPPHVIPTCTHHSPRILLHSQRKALTYTTAIVSMTICVGVMIVDHSLWMGAASGPLPVHPAG